MSSVRVAVRVRPLNKRERLLCSKVIIYMKGNTTSILKMKLSPNMRDGVSHIKDTRKNFTYDFSYDSSDRESPSFVTQEKIFKDLGSDVLKAAFEGFNACVLAYGQTGTGKSYTMMGDPGDKGLIPRICEGLFHEIAVRNEGDALSFHTEVSYLEIYNERVQDLLKKVPTSKDGGLKVREHPRDGPYVESLSKHVVRHYSDIEELMTTGNENRTTASTRMNDASSRSHSIFTLNFTQARFDADLPCETVSKIHLVDLAGSERADATLATGTRLKEGANINKSLVTLGNVISALADLCEAGLSTKKKQVFIPYRDSVLTWLLKDSLGGNSKTIMIANVNYGETLSTLRYASRAKNIMNTPTVNEDGSCKVIRELKAEIVRLRGLVEQAEQAPREDSSLHLRVEEKLHQNEAKVLQLTREWTNKWGETEDILKEETVALRKEGSGVVLDSLIPHLIGIDEDLLGPGIILYHLKEGRTLVGNEGSCRWDIVLHGPGLLNEHCVLENSAGTVQLIPQRGALCLVNGTKVTEPYQLAQGDMIQLGKGTVFRFNHPTEAAQLREKRKNGLLSFSLSMTDLSKSTENMAKVMLLNPGRIEKQESPDIKRRAKPSEESVSPCQRRGTEELWHMERGVALCHSTVRLPSEQHQPVKDAVSDQRMAVLTEVNAEPKLPDKAPLLPSWELSRLWPAVKKSGSFVGSVRGECVALRSASTQNNGEILTTSDATAERCPVSHSACELDGDTLRGGVSTREGPERKRAASHKSGSAATSKKLWRRAEAGAEYCRGGEGRSGDASLQQTSVLGPADGCGAVPEGAANESQGVPADSGRSSLGGARHLQSAGGTAISAAVLPPATARSPLSGKPGGSSQPEGAASDGPPRCAELRGVKRSREQEQPASRPGSLITCEEQQASRLGSLVTRVSWMFQGAGRLLWSSPGVLPQAIGGGLQPVGARWSRRVVSLVRESQVLAVVKDSQVLSLILESQVFSLVKDSRVLMAVKGLPLMQHFHAALAKDLRTAVEDAGSPKTLTLSLTQSGAAAVTLTEDLSLIQDTMCIGELEVPEQCKVDVHSKLGRSEVEGPDRRSGEPEETCAGIEDATRRPPSSNVTSELYRSLPTVEIFRQKLVQFPPALARLQSMSLHSLVDELQPLIPASVFNSQKMVALYWLSAAKCSHPQARPALAILLASGLYTVTSDLGSLLLFHHLPLLQLREVHVGLAGQSVRVAGATEESVLGLYTCSQALTKDLCRSLLTTACPWDGRPLEHPLLGGDLEELSLRWPAHVPDLLLDAGLRVCCDFQKTLVDLTYLLHCNMGHEERPRVGDVRLLLYATVRACVGSLAEGLAQLLLTDTHVGLVQEDAVFHPPPRSVALEPRSTRFQHVSVRARSAVMCVVAHGAARLDLILPAMAARGHPDRAAAVAVPPPQATNPSPHTEVWKLTFSCSGEAACLINHLSHV